MTGQKRLVKGGIRVTKKTKAAVERENTKKHVSELKRLLGKYVHFIATTWTTCTSISGYITNKLEPDWTVRPNEHEGVLKLGEYLNDLFRTFDVWYKAYLTKNERALFAKAFSKCFLPHRKDDTEVPMVCRHCEIECDREDSQIGICREIFNLHRKGELL